LHCGKTGQVLRDPLSGEFRRKSLREHTSEAMSSRPLNWRHVSLSMMFCTTGSTSARGLYRSAFCKRVRQRDWNLETPTICNEWCSKVHGNSRVLLFERLSRSTVGRRKETHKVSWIVCHFSCESKWKQSLWSTCKS
jgi:hypothetical protein